LSDREGRKALPVEPSTETGLLLAALIEEIRGLRKDLANEAKRKR